MVDEVAKRLRDVVRMQVGDVPVMIHQAADHIDALAAKLKEVEEMKRLLAVDKTNLRGELAASEQDRQTAEDQIAASKSALMDLCRKQGMPEDTDMCLQWLDERLAKLAEADALIEAQQKDYASNNVRFAEAEHRAKAAEAKLAGIEAERDQMRMLKNNAQFHEKKQTARADAAERRERQLLDVSAACRLLQRERNALSAEVERLKVELATARDDALEEAAHVATWYGTDRGFPDGKTGAFRKHRGKIAEQIRAMKGPKP